VAKIYVVRHGKAAAGFGSHADPGLDELGRKQAQAAADMLAPLGPMAIASSPLARAQETAIPLAQHWQADVRLEPRMAEIPSPTTDLTERAQWLSGVMAGSWADQSDALHQWRGSLVECLLGINEDTVIFSHFVAINVAVAAATNDDRLTVFMPDNASVTEFHNDTGKLTLISQGRVAQTKVN